MDYLISERAGRPPAPVVSYRGSEMRPSLELANRGQRLRFSMTSDLHRRAPSPRASAVLLVIVKSGLLPVH